MKQIIVFFMALASFLYGTPFAVAQDFSAIFAALEETGTGKVIEVIAPDTIQVDNGQIIRLSGIYFPDYDPREPGEFSLTAVEILKDMLAGKRVRIFQTADEKWGRQNRLGHQIAHIQREDDGMWAQGAMLSLGLAVVRTGQRTPEAAAEMLALEKEARDQKLGIWAEDGGVMGIIAPEDAAGWMGRFAIVEGKIESVALNENRLYINFGKNWQDDFTVSIAPEDYRLFTDAGLDPLQWGGRVIRVRGDVREYNGPYIEIDHPEVIEIPE